MMQPTVKTKKTFIVQNIDNDNEKVMIGPPDQLDSTQSDGELSEVSGRTTRNCDRLKTGASCQALKHAVASLHRLDDFHKEKIGSGFFSEVFKVTHRVTGQVMVLKMNLLRSNRRNMLKEVQLMNKLSHPNILGLLGVCVHEGQLHALTEYINGGSMEQLIQNRSIDLSQLCRVSLARDISSGMSYLHSKDVFHRDLTSKNVLIRRLPPTVDDPLFRAVVADFGLASSIPDSKTRLCTVGSPYWMSPECLKGHYYNQRSDVFSYGIVLCELIARVEADPDKLPRTDNFGLDYLAFTELCGANVVPDFLTLAFRCCAVEPSSRPTFTEIVPILNDIMTHLMNCGFALPSKSVEQLPTDEMVPLVNVPQHRKSTYRRSLSEDMSLLTSTLSLHQTPSDKARRHALNMCRQDPHYRPRATVSNPFATLAQFRGVKKFVGNQSCCELHIPTTTTTTTTSSTACSVGTSSTIGNSTSTSPHSLPGSPTSHRRHHHHHHPHQHHHHNQLTPPSSSSPFCKTSSGTNLSDIIGTGGGGGCISGGGGVLVRRRGSCESGFYSSVGECLSPNSLWGGDSSLRSLDELETPFFCCKRASSIYTDSSEDLASLASDGVQSQSSDTTLLKPSISAIVDYFERKGTTFGRHSGSTRANLQLSSRIAALRRCLERQQQTTAPLLTTTTSIQPALNHQQHHHLTTTTCTATNQSGMCISSSNSSSSGGGGIEFQSVMRQKPKCTRLVICEGAVKSKLPLFDKKT